MKVLFLDIDGVLNSANYRKQKGADYIFSIVDETKIPLLKKIIDATGAELVLSSSWRKGWYFHQDADTFGGNYFDKLFEKYSLNIYSKTPVLEHCQRAKEIRLWLVDYSQKGIESFAIIDDIDFFVNDVDLRQHFVQTSDDFGLTEENVIEAIKKLNSIDLI